MRKKLIKKNLRNIHKKSNGKTDGRNQTKYTITIKLNEVNLTVTRDYQVQMF